jgi:hypothetical protein
LFTNDEDSTASKKQKKVSVPLHMFQNILLDPVNH